MSLFSWKRQDDDYIEPEKKEPAKEVSVEGGKLISLKEGKLVVPDNPIVAVIKGDGVGPEVIECAQKVIDATLIEVYKKEKEIKWLEIEMGQAAFDSVGEHIPIDHIEAIHQCHVCLKGPLETLPGSGVASLNVALRQVLDLYQGISTISHIDGVPTPLTNPENIKLTFFRENIEDLYTGIEFEHKSEASEFFIKHIENSTGYPLPEDAALAIKSLSKSNSKRIVREAIRFAIRNKKRIVTIAHKGNILRDTEGLFKSWAYEVAREEFPEYCVTETECVRFHDGRLPPGKILINDRVIDTVFQHIVTHPQDYQIIVATNLNGDYLVDASAALVGGVGLVPISNKGDETSMFEVGHGSMPRIAGRDKMNPTSAILAGVNLLAHLGWKEAASAIAKSLTRTIKQGTMTFDLAKKRSDATEVSASDFAQTVIRNMKRL